MTAQSLSPPLHGLAMQGVTSLFIIHLSVTLYHLISYYFIYDLLLVYNSVINLIYYFPCRYT